MTIGAGLENLPSAEADAVDQIASIYSLRQRRIFALGSVNDVLYALLMRRFWHGECAQGRIAASTPYAAALKYSSALAAATKFSFRMS